MVNHDEAQAGITKRLIAACARNHWLTLLLVGLLVALGAYSIERINLDAIPDLSDTQVILLTEWEGRSPDLVEDQITYPLMTSLLSAPRIQSVRGQSFMGLSFVYAVFEEGTDIYWARSRVLEYLAAAESELPDNVTPELGPDATGVGWVFQYALVDRSGRHSLADLRDLQDFNLKYALESVPGVAEVASIGGYEREYQVLVDPDRLAGYRLSLASVADALRESNNDVGGRVLEIAGHEHFIRGRGYVQSLEDIRQVVIDTGRGGTPIRVADVAAVVEGPALQRGAAELDGEGLTVGATVVMRYGENAMEVIGRVKERIAEIEPALPDGVSIVTAYDRSALIQRAVDTLWRVLTEEMLIVSLVILLFLWHLRSALVAMIALPVAVMLAFIPMTAQGLTANIMSLGGIAVAIGAMVDASIVIIDNVHRRLHEWQSGHENGSGPESSRQAVVIRAMQEVGPSVFFSLLIITVSFVPVFALQGTEGRLFQPLAFTKSYAMLFAALLSVTLVPALVVLLVRGRIRGDDNPLDRWLRAGYGWLLRFALRGRWLVMIVMFAALGLTVPAYQSLQTEFMPPLDEGSILYMPTAVPGMSITEAQRTLQTMDRMLKSFPEVERVFGKVGRSDSATDPAPLSMVETTVTLKPQSEWRDGMTRGRLLEEMDQALRFPGMPNVWWMPIQTRTEMMATGIRATLGIKVFGPELAGIEEVATQIEQALLEDSRTAQNTRSAFAERSTGGYFIDFTVDRARAARYGFNVEDVQQTVVTAVGGRVVSQTIEGRERHNILLRYQREYRDDIEALENTLITTPEGGTVPLSQLASLSFETGPAMIRSEDGQLAGFVNVDVSDDIGIADYVEQAQEVVAERVSLPPGYRLQWAGQYQNLERARDRLSLLIPLTLVLIFLMLYLHRRSLVETLLVMLAVPFSVLGSVWLLVALDYRLSVAVAVGIIAVAGLAVELALLMMVYLDNAWRRSPVNDPEALLEAVLKGAGQRIRPLLMTALTLVIGLMPVMLSSGTGADVMKRIAAPLLGGSVTALLVSLFLMPVLFWFWKSRARHR
ncbi:MAG: CusA/CzcA family heavy metal efflux RND transporter [Pseudohongiellaceae bacterium]